MGLLLLAGVLILAAIGYSLVINRIRGLPPGPPPLPFIGNLIALGAPDLDKVFLDWKAKYGAVYTVWMPMPTVIYAEHEVIYEQIVRDADNYGNRALPEQFTKVLFGGNWGLTFEDNSIWKEQRSFALRVMRNLGVGSSSLQDVTISLAQESLKRWKSHGENQPIDIAPAIMGASANVIWQLTFGHSLSFDDPLIRKVPDLIKTVNQHAAHPVTMLLEYFPRLAMSIEHYFGSPISEMKNANDQILDLMEKEIHQTQKTFNYDDTPSCYIEAFLAEMQKRENNNDSDQGAFNAHQAKIGAYDLWFAGFDTTIITVLYAIHYIINHPDVQQKMHDEIDEQIGTRAIRFDDQKLLPYCVAVLHETQRLANIFPVNLTRQTIRDTVAGGHSIPAGSTVIHQFHIVHVDPEEFERPYHFCPERHLDEDGKFVKDPRINPFSVGKRACLGEKLARMEIFIFLMSAVQHFVFKPVGTVPPKLELLEGSLRCPKPFMVRLEHRFNDE